MPLSAATRPYLRPASLKFAWIFLALVAPHTSLGQAALKPCGPAACPYLNPSLSPNERAADLVSRLTLEEKVSQTLDVAAAIPRLNVPAYNWWNEALHGVARNGTATTFPQAIGLAATWDAALVQQVGRVIATEGRAKYNVAQRQGDSSRYAGLTFWSPNINIFRDPRWGRGQETYGEDPYLTGRLGIAFIRGVQGDDPHYLEAIATPKHFAVHSGPEPARHGFNAKPSAYDLEDTYLPAFRAAIVEGKAQSIMCAYNAIYGSPACASDLLLQQVLRTAWSFQGYVVSDCDAVADIARGHHLGDDTHASALAMQAGTDLDCGKEYLHLVEAVQDGLVPDRVLDESLVRLFAARMRLGMFDPPSQVPFSTIPPAEVDSPAHRQLALRAARESIVLLQNRHNDLPLHAAALARIAVVGPTAELLQVSEGNYSAAAPSPVFPLQGIQRQFASSTVTYAPGSVLAQGLPTPVPSSALRSGPQLQTVGLRGEYFSNRNFSGQPQLVREDRAINFNWNRVAPSPQIDAKAFSVRWTGALVPPGAGTYRFTFRGAPAPRPAPRNVSAGETTTPRESSVTMYLDGRPVLDSAHGLLSAEETFADARPHELRIEFSHVQDDRYVSLEWSAPAEPLLAQAVAAAQASDVIIACVGLSPDLEGEEMNVHIDGFNGGDRTSLDLPAVQQHLLEALKSTGKPLIVVLTSGSALSANWADANADAVLEAWYGGEESGTAIAETLAGTNNPSGRLPVTFYHDVSELPPFDDYSMKDRTYRYFNGQVLYPFGFGLSYSSFAYEHVAASDTKLKAGDMVHLSTQVKNTSSLAGDEVVEVFVQAPNEPPGTHPFLAAFTRVHLSGGEAKKVDVALDPRQISRVDEDGTRRVRPGQYTITVNGRQPATGDASTRVQVNGTLVLPR